MNYRLRLVRPGERYGRNNVLVNDKNEPMIEFYDADYRDPDFGDMGQFVSRYFVSTLRSSRRSLETVGLNLQGDVPKWSLTGGQMVDVFDWLERAGA